MRRRTAHIPESVRFQTKPELATTMLSRLVQVHVEMKWVVADCVYGGNQDLRTFLQKLDQLYVLSVAKSEPVEFQAPTGRRREEAALIEAFLAISPLYQCLSMG